jgi:hypothetical protein
MRVTANTTAPRSFVGQFGVLPTWVWSVAALCVIALHQWATKSARLTNYLGDADDAARLVQVREFMAGAHWFDLTTTTMGGPEGMLSHWSRLIDVPIALIIKFSSLFTSTATAELVARTVWPLLVLAPLLYTIHRTASARGGEQASRIALALSILLPLGLYQFAIGRIDHHNVMIAATVSAALLMWAYSASRDAWAVAGGLNGLALVIGYESLAPAAALAILAAFWGLVDRRQARAAQAFTLTMIAALAVGFLLSIPPARWMDFRCDAISLNIVALSVVAGIGLTIAVAPQRRWTLVVRFAIAAMGAAIGVVLFGLLEPKCLAGPMGQLPAELKPIWIDYVAETRSIVRDLMTGKIEQALGLSVFFCAGITAQFARVRRTGAVNDLFLLAAVTAFVAFACWQYKYIAYASFIALVPIACWIAGLKGTASFQASSLQVIAAVLLSQSTLIGGSSLVQKTFAATPLTGTPNSLTTKAEECETNSALHDLNILPPGRIAAHIDLGAYLIAETPHRALSAPYHRIGDAIIANHHIFAARKPEDAARILAREQIDYVMTCKGLDDPFVAEEEWRGTLRANLVAGQPPAFLEPVKLANATSLFTVWRVAKDKLNPQP